MYDAVIIGCGPAGLTAAIYLLRANRKVLLLEAKNYGGQIVNTLDIENYPSMMHISGFDFATKLYEQVEALGGKVILDKVIRIKNGKKVKKVFTEKKEYETKTIIVATGCHDRKLNLELEDKLIGKGVSYCATCDGAFFKGKTVAVVGGGNTAISDALYLSNIAKKVYLIHRSKTFRADERHLELLEQKNNVEFVLFSNVTKLIGQDRLESIEINSKRMINVDGLFIAIGQIPETEFLKKNINLDESGYIISKENCHTNKDGIFVAGDVRRKKVRQLVTATSDGAVAAVEAIAYLNRNI